MKALFRIVSAIVLLFQLIHTESQAQTVSIAIDSNNVEIGSRATLTIAARIKPGQQVTVPDFSRKRCIIPELEVVGYGPTDTLGDGNGNMAVMYRYYITSFEDSTYSVPAQPVIIDSDTMYTNSLQVSFTLLQNIDSSFFAGIDTTSSAKIFDVTPVKETPFTLDEFWARFGNTILLILIVAIVAAIITYVIIRKMHNKPIIPVIKPKEPAEKVALRRLNILREMNLCQNNKTKEYYTELTEILKTYISDRYGTSVMESTSAETMQVLKEKIGQRHEAYGHMDYIFGIADFVKFAKMQPLPDENDKAMKLAFDFVEITKPVLESADTQKQPTA